MDVLVGELEKAMKRTPRKDHRTVLVHFGFAAPAQVKRWTELGGIVSANARTRVTSRGSAITVSFQARSHGSGWRGSPTRSSMPSPPMPP